MGGGEKGEAFHPGIGYDFPLSCIDSATKMREEYVVRVLRLLDAFGQFRSGLPFFNITFYRRNTTYPL